MRAGAKVVIVNLIKGLVRVTATRNEGPGKSFVGLPNQQQVPPDVDDDTLGRMVIAAMERSE